MLGLGLDTEPGRTRAPDARYKCDRVIQRVHLRRLEGDGHGGHRLPSVAQDKGQANVSLMPVLPEPVGTKVKGMQWFVELDPVGPIPRKDRGSRHDA